MVRCNFSNLESVLQSLTLSVLNLLNPYLTESKEIPFPFFKGWLETFSNTTSVSTVL